MQVKLWQVELAQRNPDSKIVLKSFVGVADISTRTTKRMENITLNILGSRAATPLEAPEPKVQTDSKFESELNQALDASPPTGKQSNIEEQEASSNQPKSVSTKQDPLLQEETIAANFAVALIPFAAVTPTPTLSSVPEIGKVLTSETGPAPIANLQSSSAAIPAVSFDSSSKTTPSVTPNNATGFLTEVNATPVVATGKFVPETGTNSIEVAPQATSQPQVSSTSKPIEPLMMVRGLEKSVTPQVLDAEMVQTLNPVSITGTTGAAPTPATVVQPTTQTPIPAPSTNPIQSNVTPIEVDATKPEVISLEPSKVAVTQTTVGQVPAPASEAIVAMTPNADQGEVEESPAPSQAESAKKLEVAAPVVQQVIAEERPVKSNQLGQDSDESVQVPITDEAANEPAVKPTASESKAVIESSKVTPRTQFADLEVDQDELKIENSDSTDTLLVSPRSELNSQKLDPAIRVESKPVEADALLKQAVIKQTIDRIEDMAIHKPLSQMTIRLNPDNLGEISVTIKTMGAKSDAEISVTNDKVMVAMQESKQQLSNTIEQKGLNLNSLTLQFGGSESGRGQQNTTEDFQRLNRMANLRSDDSAQEPTNSNHINTQTPGSLNLVI